VVQKVVQEEGDQFLVQVLHNQQVEQAIHHQFHLHKETLEVLVIMVVAMVKVVEEELLRQVQMELLEQEVQVE
tara:strand:- start:387 stop:605 length:219 start_codon:yes stop_codon:yes gene_type:complete